MEACRYLPLDSRRHGHIEVGSREGFRAKEAGTKVAFALISHVWSGFPQGTMKPHIHIFLSSCLSICLFLSVCRFVCLSDSLSVRLSLTLSLIFVYVFSSLLPSMINHIDPFNQILTIILDFTDNFVRFNVDCDILHPTRPFYNLKTTLDSQKQIFCSKWA